MKISSIVVVEQIQFYTANPGLPKLAATQDIGTVQPLNATFSVGLAQKRYG